MAVFNCNKEDLYLCSNCKEVESMRKVAIAALKEAEKLQKENEKLKWKLDKIIYKLKEKNE